MLRSPGRAVAVICFHASPLGELGRGENGGMNLVVRRCCEGLSEAGVPTDVFVRRDDPAAPAEELIAPRSRLVRLTAGPSRHLPKGEAAAHVDEFAAAVIAHALSERRTYRLVHGHYWLGGLVARQLHRVWGRPWVQSFHTLALTKLAAGLSTEPGRADAERELAREATLLAASRAEEADLRLLYGVASEAVTIVPPGVDAAPPPAAADLDALRTRLGLRGRRVILFAGRLEPLKGADVAIRVLAELSRSSAHQDTSLLVVGENSGDGGGPDGGSAGERGRLERLAASLGLADRVRFEGAVEHAELATRFALAELCLVPSRSESFGLVALEAQAMGTPVVASSVGGLVEVVEEGVTGFLVGSRSPRAFAAPVRRLLSDGSLRRRMADAGREAARRFSWEASVAGLQDRYDAVAPPQSAPLLCAAGAE